MFRRFLHMNCSGIVSTHTLQEILGGPHAAEQKYDAEFFKKFRSQNIVLSARNYARVKLLFISKYLT